MNKTELSSLIQFLEDEVRYYGDLVDSWLDLGKQYPDEERWGYRRECHVNANGHYCRQLAFVRVLDYLGQLHVNGRA